MCRHRSCGDVFNGMKLDRMMKRKLPVEIHSSKRSCSSMFLFAGRRSEADMKMIVHVPDSVESDH